MNGPTVFSNVPASLLARLEPPAFALARKVPFRLQRLALQRVLQHILAMAIADGDLDVLRGRRVRIQVTDARLGWCIGFDGARLQVLPQLGRADVEICGSARTFVLLALRREDPDSLFFRRELTLEGDTELGLAVKNLLDALEWEPFPFRAGSSPFPLRHANSRYNVRGQ